MGAAPDARGKKPDAIGARWRYVKALETLAVTVRET
jgi:hypothetical protein